MTAKEKAVISAAVKFTKAWIRYGKELDMEIEALASAVVDLKPELKEGYK